MEGIAPVCSSVCDRFGAAALEAGPQSGPLVGPVAGRVFEGFSPLC